MYDSITEAASIYIDLNSSLDSYRNVMLLISDGYSSDKDSADYDDVKLSLMDYSLSLFFVQKKTDSSDVTKQDVDTLNNIVIFTGGESTDVDSEDGIKELYDKIVNCYFVDHEIDKEKCTNDFYHNIVLSFTNNGENEEISAWTPVRTLYNLKSSETDSTDIEESSTEENKASSSDAKNEDDVEDVEGESSGISRRNLIVIIIACILLVALITVVVLLLILKKKNKSSQPASEDYEAYDSGSAPVDEEYEEAEVGNVQQSDQRVPEQQYIQPGVNAANQNVQMPGVNSPNPAQRHPQKQQPVKMIALEVRFRGQVVKRVQGNVEGSIIVGRAPICDIVIDNNMVSRQHFALEYDGQNMFIQDLATRNGTFVNGNRITQKTRITQNDRIRISSLDVIIRW